MHIQHALYRLLGAFFNTYQTSLAVVVISVRKTFFIQGNTTVGTPGNASHAFGTDIIVPDRLKYPPVTGLS